MINALQERKQGKGLRQSYDKARQHIKKQRHYFADKGLYSQNYGSSSSHEWMWESDHKDVNSRPFHFNVWQNSLQIKKKKNEAKRSQ